MQQLLTFLKGQPNLLRRQVGHRPRDRANLVRDWRDFDVSSSVECGVDKRRSVVTA